MFNNFKTLKSGLRKSAFLCALPIMSGVVGCASNSTTLAYSTAQSVGLADVALLGTGAWVAIKLASTPSWQSQVRLIGTGAYQVEVSHAMWALTSVSPAISAASDAANSVCGYGNVEFLNFQEGVRSMVLGVAPYGSGAFRCRGASGQLTLTQQAVDPKNQMNQNVGEQGKKAPLQQPEPVSTNTTVDDSMDENGMPRLPR